MVVEEVLGVLFAAMDRQDSSFQRMRRGRKWLILSVQQGSRHPLALTLRVWRRLNRVQ